MAAVLTMEPLFDTLATKAFSALGCLCFYVNPMEHGLVQFRPAPECVVTTYLMWRMVLSSIQMAYFTLEMRLELNATEVTTGLAQI
jgi:hypothetical protein